MNNSEFSPARLEKAAKALFDGRSHHLLSKHIGAPATWDNVPEVTRRDYRRDAKIVLKAYGV